MGCKSRKDGPSLEEHYNFKSTDPFGTKLAYDMLQYNFGKHYFEISDEPISEASNWWSESGSLYINISNNFYFGFCFLGDDC